MNIKHIDHIGIAVKNLEKASAFYTHILGRKIMGSETVKDQKATVSFLVFKDTKIELLQATHPEGPIAKFIDARGEGIHHIAYRVENLEKTLEELKQRGVRLIDKTPRIGAGGVKIAFIHPKESNGVLTELCEH
jgi:methylmalonyl-CoA/ethylmalonyl-CoA epimerase